MKGLMVVCNMPDADVASRIARQLVEEQLAACVNCLPPVASVYRWQGKVETATEVPLLIKTTEDAYPALETLLLALHPYDVPEIIALPVVAGLPAYLAWLESEVLKTPAAG